MSGGSETEESFRVAFDKVRRFLLRRCFKRYKTPLKKKRKQGRGRKEKEECDKFRDDGGVNVV